MKQILILSKQQFDNMEPDDRFVAIRIIDPEGETHSEKRGYKDQICLEFWDLEDPIGRFDIITARQAFKLYEFMIKHKDADYLVVHCMAGISRSNTVASFFAAHIAKDDYWSLKLASDTTKAINYAVWDALKYEAMRAGNWHIPFSKPN